MTNTLTFSSSYKSLYRFETTELPSFVVLTGRNGSGKTHLLEAIREGKIRSSLVNDPAQDVRFFTAATIIPADTGMFDPSQEQSQRSQFFKIMETHRDSSFPVLQHHAIQLGVPVSLCTSIRKIAALRESDIVEFVSSPEQATAIIEAIKQQIAGQANQVFAQSHGQIGDPHWRRAAQKILQIRPEALLADSQSRFFEHGDYVWGEVDPFQQAFGRVFTNYRELIHANDRLERYPPPDDPSRRHLPMIEFINSYGPPPWEFVNRILEECHLDFRLNNPPMHEVASYEPKLRKLSSDIEMRFQDLSSGEKVLMSFALCLYNAQEGRQAKVFPKLLLLDEIDAPLHPSMTVSLLQTIQNVLVKDRGVSVIITTHSPSTVALAPEGAIYSMDPTGPRIEKVTRSAALSILTAGVPTLAVSFDGRRQIFVESRTDARLYELLYQKYKGLLNSERSLVFVEVGRRDDTGQESNAGCDQVIRFIDSLSEGGNQSVLGLLDWDGKRLSTNRIHILSPSIRDGLESLLFDPKLLVATLAREDVQFAKEKGILDAQDTYMSLEGWDATRWQRAVDVIQKMVIGLAFDPNHVIDISYVNGITLKISKHYLHTDDHKLEKAITEVFGMLKAKNRRTGELMQHIAGTILGDYPSFLPSDLITTLKKLLEVEFID
jgi:predicted ATPase